MIKKHHPFLELLILFSFILSSSMVLLPLKIFAQDAAPLQDTVTNDSSLSSTQVFQPDTEQRRFTVQKIKHYIKLPSGDDLICGRAKTTPNVRKLSGLELHEDIPPIDWAKRSLIEGTITAVPIDISTNDFRDTVGYRNRIFEPGIQEIDGQLYAFNRYGNLLCNQRVGAFMADEKGCLSLVQPSYQADVPYISMIDDLDATVGCEPISALMGLQAKGYATDVSPKDFLSAIPISASNPKDGFVGSPYGDDFLYTSIDPQPLADYCNRYCPDGNPCHAFCDQPLSAVQQELLAGNVLVCYQTYWWEPICYDYFLIDDELTPKVANNHVRLICGYDPEKGYYVSDPYNPETPNEAYQYWIEADVFEWLWEQRQKAMIIR